MCTAPRRKSWFTFSACLKLSLSSWRLSRIVVTWRSWDQMMANIKCWLNKYVRTEGLQYLVQASWFEITSPIKACWGESVLSSQLLLKIWSKSSTDQIKAMLKLNLRCDLFFPLVDLCVLMLSLVWASFNGAAFPAMRTVQPVWAPMKTWSC